MATTEQITTAEQLLAASDLGPCELVRGELVMVPPAGYEHGSLGNRIGRRLGNYVEPRGLGDVLDSSAGFRIARDPDTVRVPDVSFVSAQRAPSGKARGFYEGAPDLAVEIISPTDRPGEVKAKAQDWLEAGCRMVWVVDPDARTVAVYRGRAKAVILRESDTLSGGDVLPGFSLPVAEIFPS